jgi:hypothetical protein
MPAPLLPAFTEMAAPDSSKFSIVAFGALIVKMPFCCAGVTPVRSILARVFPFDGTPRTVRLSVDHAHVSPS